MLPDGWKNVGLAKLADKISDGIHTTPEYTDETGLYFINGNNIKNGQISIGSGTKSVSQSEFKKHKKDLNDRTLLISINGTIGNIAYYNNEPVILGKSAAYVNVKSEISKEYIYYFLSSEITQKYFTNELTGSTIRNLSLGTIKQTPTPVPPLSEQRRIAEILSTWDRAIAVQEQLVANARAQKKALMQTLLTAKKRLPGFKGEWKTVRLDEVAFIIVSNVDKKSVGDELAVRLCNYMDVYRSDRIEADMPFMRATAATAQIKKFALQVGDVLITKDSETPDDIAIPSYVASTAPDIVCGYHLAIIRPKKMTDGQFLKFYFEHPHTRYFFGSRANGATRFGLTVGAIESAPITLPDFAEQKCIGEAIANAELEILRLVPLVQTLKREKFALMQQLLTGKRRVKVEAKA
jgi:type I restriction enzyme, S subunit